MTRFDVELDVRSLPPSKQPLEAFRTFDALKSGECFVLVSDRDPKTLLGQFQAERPGAFDWSLLEAGPERFRIEIRRRPTTGSRTVSDYLGADHRRLDAIMREVLSLAGSGSFAEAGARLAEFSCGLSRHIEVEEQILFPAFERATGFLEGPTRVMRAEHLEIRELLKRAADAIASEEGAAFAQAAGALKQLLGDHNLKEEQILYPTTDQRAGGERERDELVRQMQAF
jgi:uncharacterized protein (DUF2249 family)